MIQVILLLLVGVLTSIYFYFYFTYKHWLKKGILQETPKFLVGNLLDVVLNRKNIGWIYNEIYNKHKHHDAVGFYEFHMPKILLRNPELFEATLIKDFSSFYDNELYLDFKKNPLFVLHPFLTRGERWKPARTSLVNGLRESKLKDMYEIMKQTIPLLKNYVDSKIDSDIEAMQVAHLFIMTNVSNTVYGINSNCFTDPNASLHKMVRLYTEEYWQGWWQTIILFILQPLRDFLGLSFMPKQVTRFVERMLIEVIEVRLKNNMTRKDFLNHYLNSNKPLEEKITEIICSGITFFVAGFETSSLPSGNLIYELALNPTIQENLYKELETAYEGKSELDYETLMTLPLLDRAFNEVLRKYPIMYSFNKICTKSTTLDINGQSVKIEEGTPVVIPIYAVHHDPQYFPDPEVFDPERFTKEAEESRPLCTWMPFGAGPRICAGMNFGILQAKLFLATLLYNYRIERTDKTPSTVSFKKASFLVVPQEIQWVRMVKRR